MSLSTYTTSSGQSSCFKKSTSYTNLNFIYFGAQGFYYHQYTQLLPFSRQVTNCSSMISNRAEMPYIYISREQPNPTTRSTATEQWIHLILTYARHRRLFILRMEDAETEASDWAEILRNERINRELSVALFFLFCDSLMGRVQER